MVERATPISRFLADQKGAVTIEFTTLVPFFIFLLVFFVDASIIYMTHSEMFSVARDSVRRMSTGELETPEEVRDYAAQHLMLGDRRYVIDPSFGGNMNVTLVVSVSDAAIFGMFFRPILGRSLVATADTRMEPPLVPVN